ncbi:MAG: gliding motility-associated C-terminal domain-containing protein [Salinivirgaceae bacterium]|nr:gliding motility-associated C-terminal domain-containing protein [Salinivirgaceae bacterium]
MKRQILTVSILLVAAQLFGQESRFWVGGSGSWTDESHWSTTSGGEPGATVPESGINVVFDENSFSGARNTVSFSDAVQVGSFTATDANFALSGKKDFTVSGSINVDANVDFGKLRGALVLSGEGNNTINIFPIVPTDVIIDGGSWTLAIPLDVDGNITLKSGSLNANGHSIACAEFSATEKAELLNIKNSTVVCDKWNFRSASNLTLEAENSKILFRDTPQGNFLTIDGLKYGIIGTYRVSKASLLAIPTAVSCPENAQEVRSDGSIRVIIDGEGEYKILLSEIVLDEDGNGTIKSKSKVGSDVTFPNVAPGTHTVSYQEGTSMSQPQNVSVGYAPIFSGGIIVGTGATCWGDDLILTHDITGGTGDYTFTWENNGGGYGSSATFTAIAGRTNFLTIEDENHCIYVAEKYAYRPLGPAGMNNYTDGPERITATFDNEASCEGEETGIIHINASGGTGALSFSYAGPGSHSGTTNSPDISDLPAGEYDILISDEVGCDNTTNATKLKNPNDLNTEITSIPAPDANAGADVTICKDKLSYTVTDADAENDETISWSVSGPASITSGGDTKSPTISLDGVGDATLTMTVYNGTCNPASDKKIIHIIATPEPTMDDSDRSVCGLSTSIAASAQMGGDLEADFVSTTSGGSVSSIDGLDVTVTKAGAYTFRVKETEKSDAKCPGFSTGTVTITFYDEPSVSLTSTSGSTCGTTPVDITGSSSNCTLQWTKSSNAAGSFSSETTVNTTYTPDASDAGKTITLTLTGTSAACPVVYAYYTLTVKKVPNPSAPTIATDVCGLTTLASATHSLSGSTLTWKPTGGGLTFGSPNGETTTVTATSANTYNIYVEETLDGCPKESAATPVTFYDAPTVTITTGTSGTVCGNKTISLSATSNCTNVKWSGGAGTFSPDNSLNTVYTPGAADYGHTVTLTLTVTSNHPTVCTAPETATFELTVGDVPTPSIDDLGDICGLSTTATAHATLGGTLTWNKVSGLTISPSTGADVTLSGSNGSTYNVTVTETTTEGCSATSTSKSVTFHKAPEVTVPSPNDICETGEVEVTATATDATDLVWAATGAGTLTQTGTSSSKTAKFVPSAADQDVTLTATASNGGICSEVSKQYKFHVYANPTPSIASAIDICGTTGVITANMTTAGNTVVWNAPAGVTLTDQSETETTATITATLDEGAAYGTYAITMTETNGANCSASVTTNVTFKEKPTMKLDVYNATICAGDLFTATVTEKNGFTTFDAIASGGTADVDGDNILYQSSVSTEYKQITISVTPNDGCEVSGSEIIVLTINPKPDPKISDATVCGLEYPIPVTASSVTGISSNMAWSTPSAGAFITTDKIMKVDEEGTYILHVSESVGKCSSPAEAQITFVAEPEAKAGSDIVICADVPSITLSGAEAKHYDTSVGLTWSSSGDGTFDNATAEKPTYTFTDNERDAGSVTLTLSAPSNAPCTGAATSSITVTINPLPVPKITADDEICQDKTGTYTTESGMSNYYWSVDGGTPESGTETFDYTWTTAGPHKVSVSYTNGNGCTAAVATDFDLTVHDLPTSALSSTETSCTNGSVGLDATASGGSGSFSYAWSGDGVDYLDDDKSATPTFACTTAGTYNLTCTISDNTYGCSKDYKIVITNTQGPSAFAGKDTTICYGSDYVLLDASFENGTTIEWSSESGGTFGDINDLHTTYKPSDADLAAHKAILTLTVDSESCGKTTDKVTINILPEFVVAVGGIIPFPIASSTKIEVQVVGSIVEAYDLGYYLVAPDGTSLKLYDHKSDKGMEDLPGLWPAAGDEFDFIFTTSPALELDLAQFIMNQPQSGTFGITGDVSGIYGKNPAEGGWAVRVGGPYSTGGRLQQAVIKFTDYNYDGDLQTITFNSRQLNPVEIIPDHHTLSYISPIGLNVTCYGGNDARAVANAMGGSGVYNIFEWAKDEDFNDLVSDNDTTDLYAGTYYVRVTDSHGCKATTTVEVGQPEKIKIEKLSQDTVKCYGGNDGSILVTSSDGVGEPTYRWIDVLTSNEKSTVALASELTAGSYKVTVTDENGCTSDSIFVMPEPDSISISAIVTLTPCGTTDGEVQFTVSGGTQGKLPASKYTITCNDAGAVINNDALKVTNLMGGSITFTITDAKGCSKDTTINTIPDPMTLSFVADSIDCYNGTTSVAVVVGNGDPDFSFMWNGDNTLTDSILTGIPAGRYYVDVIDDNGCPASDTITIGQPSQIKDTIIFTQAIKCYGDNEASFYAEAKGGTPNKGSYSYTWFNVSTSETVADSVLSNVGAGKYIVTIADSNHCQITDTVTIKQPEKALAVLSADTVKSECAVPTGKIKLNLEGGVQPYSFSWFVENTTDIIGTADSIENIAADIYVAKIVDSLGCAIYDTVEVLDKGNIEFGEPVTKDVACIQHPTGEATINTVYGLDADGNINNVFTNSMIIWNGTDTVAQGKTVKTLHYGSNRVVVVADDGCRRAGSVNIGNTLALRVTNIANYPDLTGDPNCDGSLTVTIGGGIGGYTYAWTDASNNSLESQDAATTTTVYSLCEGYYTLHVEDENPLGCEIDTIIQIEHRPLSCDTIQLVATTCYGGDNGVLEVSGVGGYYEAYKYEWTSENWPADSVATTASISGLKAGLYTVVISQSNGRVSDTTTIEVGQPTTRLHIPDADIITTGSHCYDSIGTISIFEPANLAAEFGGNVPFKYYFSHSDWTDSVVVNSGANPKVSGLPTDNYNLLVVDDLGCQFDTVINVADLSQFTITRTDSTAPRCYDYADGKLAIVATSQSGPNFTYLWSNGETTASIGGLAAGTYSVVVTDDSLCVKTDTFELGQPMPIVFSVSSTIPNSCYNLADGTVEISGLEGGAGAFNRFEFFGNEYYEQTPSVDTSVVSFSGLLSTGNYKVRVTDVKSCVSDSVPLRVYSANPEIMVLKVDLSLPLCDTYTDAGELSLDGSLNVTAFYSVSSTITGVDTIENSKLRYRIDGGKVQSSGQFSGLASGRHVITIGYGDTLSCSTTVSRKLGSRNGFAIDDIYFANTQSDEIFTCPDNELKAYAHTTSAYKSMKWYTPYVEEEEEEETVVEPDTTSADTTRIDTALAISKMRHYFLRANGDSTELDSVISDSIQTDSVPVAEEPVKPRYVIDADGNVVLGVDSVGSEPDFILPFTFLPYGGDTYYYVKATNGVCMAIDSLHAVAMKPDNKLKTHIEMDGFDSEALKNNGVYEVAEGAELYLVANTLTFDMLYSYEYENNFQWATNTDNAFWMSSHDTMPAVVRPFAENLTFKVSDSVMFYLEDTTFACRYTESVDVRTVSGIKPADVFTPNGDAYNETWGIDGLSSYEHVNIYVFNRWGGRVWQFSGSGLEYAANQWNGRNAKNKPLPSGTYYYVIQCSSDKLGGKKKTGPVTIVR